MASVVYNKFKYEVGLGNIDLENDDIRVLLVRSGSSILTEPAVANVGAFTTLNECNAAGYSRQTLANKDWRQDDGNNRGELDFDEVDFGSIASGNTIIGMLVYKFITNDAGSIPICGIDFTNDVVTDGNKVKYDPGAEGALHLT